MAVDRDSDRAVAPVQPEPAQRRETPYDLIKRAILSGEFEPGHQLVVSALATLCDVSRTPVREALMLLEQDGLVDRTEHGPEVRKRSPEEIMDVYDTRLVLEATAGRVAAERRTAHDIRTLRRLLVLGAEVDATDARAMVSANQQLHRAIWRAGRNKSLIDLLERLNLRLARYPETTLSFPGRWEQSLREHEALVDAIEQRDGDRAHEIAQNHFTSARDIRLKLFDDEQDLDN